MPDQVAVCNHCLGSLHRITPLFTNNSSFPIWIAKLTALVESQPHRPHAKLESTEKATTSYPGEQLLTLVPQKQKKLCCHLMLKGQKCMPLSAAVEEAAAYEGGTTVMWQKKLEARSGTLAHALLPSSTARGVHSSTASEVLREPSRVVCCKYHLRVCLPLG